jgi:hypothetical protein
LTLFALYALSRLHNTDFQNRLAQQQGCQIFESRKPWWLSKPDLIVDEAYSQL